MSINRDQADLFFKKQNQIAEYIGTKQAEHAGKLSSNDEMKVKSAQKEMRKVILKQSEENLRRRNVLLGKAIKVLGKDEALRRFRGQDA